MNGARQMLFCVFVQGQDLDELRPLLDESL
jgi:hypothetical protein